jgi:hypothetical protein
MQAFSAIAPRFKSLEWQGICCSGWPCHIRRHRGLSYSILLFPRSLLNEHMKGKPMPDVARFAVFMTAAFLLFVALLQFTVRKRKTKPALKTLLAIGFIVVVLGMLFARYSHIAFPRLLWEIYYGVPALTTILLAPIWLRMSRYELLRYLPLAWLTAPVIHVFFSLFVGWHDYMPFPVYIPSIVELVRRSGV